MKNPRSFRFREFATALLLGSLAGCGQRDYSNHANHVELVMGSSSPTPATTFELRFESAMVKADSVGLPATNSPLAIHPSLAGTFTWLSTRSGVFTPSEPLALDTTYELSLARDLRRDDGHASDATLHWTVTTPGFDMVAASPQYPDTNANSEPEIKLVFNADVRAADAVGKFEFRDAAGHRIPADVRQGTVEELWNRYEFGYAGSLHTWKEDSAVINHSGTKNNDSAEEESSTNEAPNLLVVSPHRALPIGDGWKLLVSDGIAGADHLMKSREKHEVAVGNVTPFTVRRIEAKNILNTGPSIQIEFSKPIPQSLTNTFQELTELSSAPTNLNVQVWGRQLMLFGNFQGGVDYTLKLLPGFQADEPFALQGSNTFTLTVPHVPSRLYFPALLRDQLAGGNREFPLLSINVARVRVRAKLMDPHTAIHALRGYASYFASREDRANFTWEEPYRSIDYNVVPGTTVFDKEFDLGWQSAESDTSKKLNLNWDEMLKGRGAGVVFLDAERIDGNHPTPLGCQTIIQLTDLGMVWKKSRMGVDVFAFSQNTGQPVSGATARLFGNENQPLREAVTDTNGLAHLEAATNADWIAIQQEDDFHALMLDGNRMWTYESDVPTTGSNEQEDTRRVMLFADRDLYRPGEAMHLEALVRDWAAAGLAIPLGLTGRLECVDARNHRFFETNVALSSLGSWSTLVPLPVGPRGMYSARLCLASNYYSYSFQVQDFQPNAFEILLPCKDSYAAGESIALPLSAHYLFGKSLSRAQIKWSADASDTDFHAAGFEGFSFRRDDFESRYGRGRSSISLTGRGMLLGTSNFVIAPEVPANPAAPQPRAVSLLAEVTDVNQQTLSHRVGFVRHSSDFYLGLRQAADVLTNGADIPLEVVAIGADGKAWPETVKAQMSLRGVDWQSVRIQGAGKAVRFRNEAVFSNILEKEISVDPVPAPKSPDDKARGNPLAGLPQLAAGQYVVEVKAEDAAGRPIISSLNFQVTAPAEMGWNYRNDVQLTLKPDHESYAPGETAEILVEAPFSGTALVSVEREKVLRSFVTHLEGNAPSIRIPLEPGDVPNVFVSVTLTRGSESSPHKIKEPEYRVGSCELPVMNPENKLGVKIIPTETTYLPGHPVDVNVEVTDSAQRPVPGAEMILYAVDDGILGLTDYTLPDPYSFFYASRPLSVQSCVSLPNLLSEDPDQLVFQNKGYTGGGGGTDRIRKNFLACAFWNATLVTGADGKTHARFTAPDSLTRYRLFAVAHTADSHFGSSQSAFHVSKPLVVEPSLPSFANITDHLVARAVVLNQTKIAGPVIVTLELDDKARAAGTGTVLSNSAVIPANGSATVEFPVEFIDTGEAKWVWRAHFADPAASDFTDAVQSTMAIGHIAPMLGEVLLTRATSLETNLLGSANPQLLGGRGTITVTVANTRLNELGEAASELLHYPYGCAEQTGSSLLPWILFRDTPGLLWLPQHGTNEAAAAIHAGIERLFSMQTDSGGLGYWPQAKEPMLWASAYGGMVLALAQRHGMAVPKAQFDSLMTYLSERLRSPDENTPELSDHCLGVYALALAGRPEPAYHEKLYSLRGKLSAEDKALLALAIGEARGPAEMMADLLRTNAPVNVSDEDRFGCPTRAQAIRLMAWILYRPDAPIVDHLVDDLMREQKNARWYTTQGNAWGLLALTEYAKRVEITRQPTDGRLNYAGESLPFHLDENTSVFAHTFAFTNLASAMLLAKDSTNRLYTTVSIEARPPETAQPRQDRGFDLQRRYDRLDDNNQPQGTNGLQVGDRVLVTLRLTVREWARYMVIDDALPATLEAVNPEFRTQEARPPNVDDGNRWMWDFREIRKDRCLSFANWVAPGTYTLRYVARVRAAGSVTAPSAKAEEMYHPEHCGLTESQTVVSEGFK